MEKHENPEFDLDDILNEFHEDAGESAAEPAEAEETRQFLNQFFADLPSLLNMLRSSRPR